MAHLDLARSTERPVLRRQGGEPSIRP